MPKIVELQGPVYTKLYNELEAALDWTEESDTGDASHHIENALNILRKALRQSNPDDDDDEDDDEYED